MIIALHFTLTLKYYKSQVLIDHLLKLNKLRNYGNYFNGLNTSIKKVKDTYPRLNLNYLMFGR